jgi:hypothetical protein
MRRTGLSLVITYFLCIYMALLHSLVQYAFTCLTREIKCTELNIQCAEQDERVGYVIHTKQRQAVCLKFNETCLHTLANLLIMVRHDKKKNDDRNLPAVFTHSTAGKPNSLYITLTKI